MIIQKPRQSILYFAAAALLGALSTINILIPIGIFLLVVGLFVFWIAWYRPCWLIYFLIGFIPFETFILKFTPGTETTYLLANFISEALIYLLFGILLIKRFMKNRFIGKTPIDKWFIAFIFVACLSLIANQAPIFSSIVNIRSLIRYIILFYLVANLDFSDNQVKRMMSLIVVIGFIQIFIGLLQLVFGESVSAIFLPREVGSDIGGITRGYRLLGRGREINAITGVSGDTVFFALFLLIGMTVFIGLSKKLQSKQLFVIGIFFIAINFAYTRGVVLGVLIVLTVYLIIYNGIKKFFILVWSSLLGALVVLFAISNLSLKAAQFVNPLKESISIVDNLTGIFSEEYFQRAQFQRLGSLLGVPPTVLTNKPLLGYGPDEVTTVEGLNNSQPSYLSTVMVKERFEDVYWVALLSFYGLAGLIVWIFIFYRLFQFSYNVYRNTTFQDAVIKGLSLTVICLVVVTTVLLFFYNVLEFRQYSFYFWLLNGLLVSQVRQSYNLAR